MRTLIGNASLKRLSWLAAIPISLASFGASIVPAQANEYKSYEHNSIRYDPHSPDYTYCSRWEYRHEYRCTSYYQPRYQENHHSRYDKWDYRHHKNNYHHNSYGSNWKKW